MLKFRDKSRDFFISSFIKSLVRLGTAGLIVDVAAKYKINIGKAIKGVDIKVPATLTLGVKLLLLMY